MRHKLQYHVTGLLSASTLVNPKPGQIEAKTCALGSDICHCDASKSIRETLLHA